MRHHTQHERALRHRTSPYIAARRCTALYARLMQATLGPKHASNLTNVIPHDKFQPCHWPLLAYVALHVLRCVLLEIALNMPGHVCKAGNRTPRINAGSVVLEGAWRQDTAAPPTAPCVWPWYAYPGQTHGMLAHFMVRLYIAVVCKWEPTVLSYGEALADRIVLYRIVSIYQYSIGNRVQVITKFYCFRDGQILIFCWIMDSDIRRLKFGRIRIQPHRFLAVTVVGLL